MVNTAPLSTKRGERSGGSLRLPTAGFRRTHRSAPAVGSWRSLMSLRSLGSLRSLWPILCIFRAFCRGRPVCLPFVFELPPQLRCSSLFVERGTVFPAHVRTCGTIVPLWEEGRAQRREFEITHRVFRADTSVRPYGWRCHPALL